MLVAAMDPCPCGYLGDVKRECRCSIALTCTSKCRQSRPRHLKHANGGELCGDPRAGGRGGGVYLRRSSSTKKRPPPNRRATPSATGPAVGAGAADICALLFTTPGSVGINPVAMSHKPSATSPDAMSASVIRTSQHGVRRVVDPSDSSPRETCWISRPSGATR